MRYDVPSPNTTVITQFSIIGFTETRIKNFQSLKAAKSKIILRALCVIKVLTKGCINYVFY